MPTVKALRRAAQRLSVEDFVAEFGDAALVIKPAPEVVQRQWLALPIAPTVGSPSAQLLSEVFLMLRALTELEVHLLREPLVRIGRAPELDVVLEHPSVSKRHASLRWSGRWCVVDEGSLNGTSINEQPIGVESEVTDGDVIGVGDVALIFISTRTLHGQFSSLGDVGSE